MSYIITGTDSAGALSLKRDSAAAAILLLILCILPPAARTSEHIFEI
jgi:hypothetical protein